MLQRRTVELHPRLLVGLNLSHSRIALKSVRIALEYASLEDRLVTALQKDILQRDPTIRIEPETSKADWVLLLAIKSVDLPHVQTSSQPSAKQTRWWGTLVAQYQVISQSGGEGDKRLVTATYDQTFSDRRGAAGLNGFVLKMPAHTPSAPQDITDVQHLLVNDAVSQIEAELGLPSATVEVPLATGEEHLNRAAASMQGGKWANALAELQASDPFPKPEHESYRQYDLGVAYEAIGYNAADGDQQRLSLLQAALYYDKAAELNPREKQFIGSLARITSVVSRVSAIDSSRRAQRASASSQSSSLSGKADITANDVADMFMAGVPASQIVEAIRDSPVDYSPADPQSAIALTKAKVPMTVQNELRKKVGAAPLSSAGSTSASVFPWPPPSPSAREILPERFFQKLGNLGEFDAELSQALEHAGYTEKAYYLIPDGFLVVTRMEQINPDGTPKPARERWSPELMPFSGFSLTRYLQSLLTAQPGRYRVIALAITDVAFTTTETRVTRQQAIDWTEAGLNKLPAAVKKKSADALYSCTALIYEFEKPQNNDAIELIPSHLDARTHLVKSGFWAALTLGR